ncbi:MAG TPA: S9 family peptidase, partial [Alphaproteobacteria bacterium]|nr:S9 family peptidase [Alphaproteobacteria bacterium]
MNFTLRSLASVSVFVALLITGRALQPAQAQSADAAQTTVAKAPPVTPDGSDPFLWLEDKDGARAMAWVKEQNAKTLPVLEGDPHFKALYASALGVAQSKSRIPYPRTIGGAIYNFWQDDDHVRGIWRRTSVASYAGASPQWTTVLDLDAVSASEKANWVWHGAQCDWPAQTRCLLSLSNGGEDADTVREFDLTTRSFVSGGFDLPRSKQNVAWEDDDTILVAREWTPGDLTASGYPYVVKRLRRGQPLASAVEVFRGEKSDVAVTPLTLHDGSGHAVTIIDRGVTFFTSKDYILTPAGPKQLGTPAKVDFEALVDDRLILSLNQDWDVAGKHFSQGSLVAVDASAAKADPDHLSPVLIFAPGPRESIESVSATRSHLLVTIYQNVRGHAFVFT